MTHSKSICIANQKFGKKSYLSDRRMSKEDIQLLFKLRTRMVDCKSNFEGQYREDMSCRACKVIGSVEVRTIFCPVRCLSLIAMMSSSGMYMGVWSSSIKQHRCSRKYCEEGKFTLMLPIHLLRRPSCSILLYVLLWI